MHNNYEGLTMTCVLVAAVAAILHEYGGEYQWMVTGVAFSAAITSLILYFRRHFSNLG